MNARKVVRSLMWLMVIIDCIFVVVFGVAAVMGMKDASNYSAMAMGRAAFYKAIILDKML